MLTELRKCLKAEKRDNHIFDIVLYGSAAKGKIDPQDIDILVIFREGTLKERLAKLQDIKTKIKLEKKTDLKAILWEELFGDEFFARAGIFLEGISVFDGRTIAEKTGFSAATIFTYSLKEKSHTEKVKFNYVLSGRNTAGIVKKLQGKHLAPGVILIPIKHSPEFEDVLRMHKINYQAKNILVQQ
ncbi:MAG: nucleotidyltransferase domain-containing protein [Nanoarchaeota archaeon]